MMNREAESLVRSWKSSGLITDKRVLNAILNVDRRIFVLPEYINEAYEDVALPFLRGQTISQPYTVAFMSQALRVFEGAKIFEVGAGSGYHAAVLSFLAGEKGRVFTIEIDPFIARRARDNLKRAGIKNVVVLEGDGSRGYKEEAPFDRVIFTAAPSTVAEEIISQLNEEGIVVAPLRRGVLGEMMVRIIKRKKKLIKENLGWFRFVPLRHSP